ncbi:MAG: hypothetical protein HPY66_1179 [Firmicutes bacterium]|nr:hypothetical protein [Bacillota bacterium]
MEAARAKGGFFSQARQTETLTREGYHGRIHSLHRSTIININIVDNWFFLL